MGLAARQEPGREGRARRPQSALSALSPPRGLPPQRLEGELQEKKDQLRELMKQRDDIAREGLRELKLVSKQLADAQKQIASAAQQLNAAR